MPLWEYGMYYFELASRYERSGVENGEERPKVLGA
jgi:hypothetical protein